MSKGVRDDIIEKSIFEAEIDEEQTILRLAEKFMKYKENTSQNKQKLVAYLYRKGFDYSSIQYVMRRLDIDEEFD